MLPTTPTAASLTSPTSGRERILDAFLRGRKPATVRAYAAALDAFAAYCGQSRDEATQCLLGSNVTDAHVLVLGWVEYMTASGLAPATVSARLAALRTLVKLARTFGLVGWTLDVTGPQAERYRDTRGPGEDIVKRMIRLTSGADTPIATRDTAILVLLYTLALRRGEIVNLDREHVDLAGARLWILGKGRANREARTLPAPAVAALQRWLAVRGDAPGPLFFGLATGNHVRTRMDGSSIYRLVRAYGGEVGAAAPVRPHGLRHTAITGALDRAQGDVRKVQQFSRHKKIETVMIYDDARRDSAGEIATLLGEDL